MIFSCTRTGRRTWAVRFLRAATFACGCLGAASSAEEAAEPPIQVFLDTGDLAHHLDPAAEGAVSLYVENQADSALEGRLLVEIEDFFGNRRAAAFPLRVAAGDRQRVPLDVGLLRLAPPAGGAAEGEALQRGIRWLECSVESGGATVHRDRLALACLSATTPAPTPSGPGQMRLGICYGAGTDNIDPQTIEKSVRAGFNTYRGNIKWKTAQPEADDPIRIGERTMARFDLHEAAGIDSQPMLMGTPAWASDSGHLRAHPDLEAWRRWVRAAAEAFEGRDVVAWETWNEPDIGFYKGTQDEYVELQRATYEAIKSVDPDMTVMTGGFVTMDGHPRRKKGLVARVIDECQDHYDSIAYHTHGPFEKFRKELDETLIPYRDRVVREPKQLYFTETGMDTRYGQRFQAEAVVKKIAFAWSRGATGFTWFSMHDLHRTAFPRQPGQTYGLYTKNKKVPVFELETPAGNESRIASYPKASYVAMNALAGRLGGATFLQQFDLPEDQFVFAFERGGERVLVGWNQSDAAAAPSRLLRTDATHAEVVDLMGNASEVAVADGLVALDLGSTPAYLVLHGATGLPTFEGVVAEVPLLEVASFQEPIEIRAELQNVTSEPVEFDLEWRPGPAFRSLTAGQRLQIPAGGRAIVGGRLELVGTDDFAVGDVVENGLAYRVASTGLAGTIRFPMKLNALTAAEGGYPGVPSLVLGRSEQVVNRFEHDPAMIKSLWGGSGDLSAEAYVAAEADSLKLRLEVRDDVWHGPESDSMNAGDRVVVALADAAGEPPRLIRVAEVGGEAVVVVEGGQGLRSGAPDARILRPEPGKVAAVYEIEVPLAAVGLTWEGLRMNLVVHDHDGRRHGDESSIQSIEATDVEVQRPRGWPLILQRSTVPSETGRGGEQP